MISGFYFLSLWYLYLFFPLALLTYNWHLKLCKFKVDNVMIWYMYCEIITTIRLVNTFFTPHNYYFGFKSYSLSKFQGHNVVLLSIVIMLYIRCPQLVHLMTEGRILWQIFPHFPYHSAPWETPFYSLLLGVHFFLLFRFHICMWGSIRVVWFILFSIMPSRFIHVVENSRISFFFNVLVYISQTLYLFTH